MNHIMVDLETLGNGSNSVIVSIGAARFDTTGITDEFYTVVDPQSCADYRLRVDVSTVMWWLKQSEGARAAITKPGLSLPVALGEFSNWVGRDAQIWGNGATFDNVILGNAYKACSLRQPWKFTNDRCYRTLKNLYPQIGADDRSGVYHNALDDARYQAAHAIKILNVNNLWS